jgi:hypothetical protein
MLQRRDQIIIQHSSTAWDRRFWVTFENPVFPNTLGKSLRCRGFLNQNATKILSTLEKLADLLDKVGSHCRKITFRTRCQVRSHNMAALQIKTRQKRNRHTTKSLP